MRIPLTLVLAVLCSAASLAAQLATWARQTVGAAPSTSTVFNYGIAFDPHRNVCVALGFGGNLGGGPFETWEYDGFSWSRVAVGTNLPGDRRLVGLFFNTARQRIQGATSEQNSDVEIWEYDGVGGWTEIVATVPLAGKNSPVVTYDTARERAVLHGGDIGGWPRPGTWEFDGTSWTQRSNGGPLPRIEHVQCYDAARQQTLIFGGDDGSLSFGSPYGDTWLWSGSQWSENFGIASPPGRSRAHASYDARQQFVILAGGWGTSGELHDTWYWDGLAWTAIVTPGPPHGGRMAYDAARDVTVMLLPDGQTWELGFRAPVPGTVTPTGSGCPGSNGIPALQLVSSPPHINEALTLDLTGASTSVVSTCFGLVGLPDPSTPIDLGVVGMTGCSLYAVPDVVVQLNPVSGVARWTLPIPPRQGLVGQTFILQGLCIDLGVNALGATTTNGAEIVIGRR